VKNQIVAGLVIVITALSGAGCGEPPTGPFATLDFTLTANPNPATGALGTSCGPLVGERESKTTITIRETGGAAGTVTSVAMVLRENGSNAVIAQGEFDGAGIAQLAGTNRVTANGTLNVLCGVHYPPAQQGKAATLTYTVRVTDDRGSVASREIVVSITAT
jgi:hypothetical protein